jgi:hypothetical protein
MNATSGLSASFFNLGGARQGHQAKTPMYLNPLDEGHKAFARKIVLLGEHNLMAMFIKPQPFEFTKNTKRAFTIAAESKARQKHSSRAQDRFEEISAFVLSMFPDVTVPLLNEELIAIIRAALKMENSSLLEKNHVRVYVKIDGMRFENYVESPFYDHKIVQQAAQLNSVGIAVSISPIVTSQQNVSGEGASIKLPAVSQKLPNIHLLIEKQSDKFLNTVREFGYTRFEKGEDKKGEDTLNLLKANGHKIEIAQDGRMQSSSLPLSDAKERLAASLSKDILAMVNIFLELAKTHGNQVTFPKGPANISIALDMKYEDTQSMTKGSLSKTDQEKVKELDVMVEKIVKTALAEPRYSGIRNELLYNGKKIEAQTARGNNENQEPTIAQQGFGFR